VRLPAGLLLAGAVASGAASPTPLRVEARTADAVYTDGDRYAVIEDRGALETHDTPTGGKHEVDATGCQVGSFAYVQTHVSAGLALLQCAGGFDVLDLATGRRTPLPAEIMVDGVPTPALYSHTSTSTIPTCGSARTAGRTAASRARGSAPTSGPTCSTEARRSAAAAAGSCTDCPTPCRT
jgi:hypothetical protein